LAALHSVGTAATLAAAGMYLHRRDFVTVETKTVLAKFSQQVAMPAFFFSRIVDCPQNSSSEKCPNVIDHIGDAWILLLWPGYVVGWGLLIGYIATYLARTPSYQRWSVIVATAFANSSGLPVTLLAVVQSNFPHDKGQGSTIDPTIFLSIYLILYQVLQWGIGSWLLTADHDMCPRMVDSATHSIQQRPAIELVKQPTLSDLLESGNSASSPDGEEEEEERLLSSLSSRLSLTSTESSSANRDSKSANVDAFQEQDRPCLGTAWKVVSKVCQPPVMGALFGVCVAAIKPLRGLFVDLKDRDNDAIFEFFFDAVYTIGRAAIPVNMAVLGVNLSMAAQSKRKDLVGPRTIASVVIGKMIVMPIIGISTTLLLQKYPWNMPQSIHSSFYMVMMIVCITPTANNVAVMTDLSGSGMTEDIAKIVGWEYAVSPIILPLTVMLVVHVATMQRG